MRPRRMGRLVAEEHTTSRNGAARAGLQRAASTEDVPDEGTLGVTLPGGETVCLARSGGETYAVGGHCTHQECPMADGVVMSDGTIECIWHGARFDLRTGAVRRGPARDPLPVYEVAVREGEVWIGERRR